VVGEGKAVTSTDRDGREGEICCLSLQAGCPGFCLVLHPGKSDLRCSG
jgi:hypothetical protein